MTDHRVAADMVTTTTGLVNAVAHGGFTAGVDLEMRERPGRRAGREHLDTVSELLLGRLTRNTSGDPA